MKEYIKPQVEIIFQLTTGRSSEASVEAPTESIGSGPVPIRYVVIMAMNIHSPKTKPRCILLFPYHIKWQILIDFLIPTD